MGVLPDIYQWRFELYFELQNFRFQARNNCHYTTAAAAAYKPPIVYKYRKTFQKHIPLLSALLSISPSEASSGNIDDMVTSGMAGSMVTWADEISPSCSSSLYSPVLSKS